MNYVNFVYKLSSLLFIEASPFANEIVQLTLKYIKYDSNFVDGGEDKDELEVNMNGLQAWLC